MANVSVPNRSKPITLLALKAVCTDWLSIRGFHDGPSDTRSSQGRIHDCNRFIHPRPRTQSNPVTCRGSPYRIVRARSLANARSWEHGIVECDGSMRRGTNLCRDLLHVKDSRTDFVERNKVDENFS